MDGQTLIELLASFLDDEVISETFALQLLNLAKDNIEMRRPWMKLRKLNSNFSFTSSDGYTDLKDLPDDFLMTYSEYPLVLVSGSDVIAFKETPLEERDFNKDNFGTFYIYHNENKLAIHGGLTKSYTGTLYFVGKSDDITTSTTWLFPKMAHPLLVIEALKIYRGQVDFDEINARMTVEGYATAEVMEKTLDMWDAQLQVRSRRGRTKGKIF